MSGYDLPTTTGELRLEEDRVSIARNPLALLRNQGRRLRRGEWLRAVVILAIALGGVIFTAMDTARVISALQSGSLELLVPGALGSVGVLLGYALYVHPQHIPLEQIDRIDVDPGNQTLLVRTSPEISRFKRLLRAYRRPTVSLRDEEDLRTVVEWLEFRGVSFEEVEGGLDRPATDAEYAWIRRGGGYFCPDCGERVSPRDEHCGACGRRLLQRLET